MKKFYLTLIAVLSVLQFTYAQWTNVSGTGNYYLNSGNVGIGTSAPASNLHVYEPLSDSKPSGIIAPTKSIFKISRLGTTNYSYNESAEFRIGHGGPSVSGSQLDLYINGPANTSNIPDQQVMTWLYNGYVGIGTTTPQQKFAVSNNGAEGLEVYLAQPTGLVGLQSFNRATSSYSKMQFDASQFAFMEGNVLIGQASQMNSAYKLDVLGSVRANAITVNVTGADFVFEPTYKLYSLPDLKSYIDQNHHLPEIPSAKEMQADGLNVGDNQIKLLQKVEELTLYLIEKDKTLNTQQEEIDQLKQQMQILINASNKH